jgi:lysophospholipase L1-like esterase
VILGKHVYRREPRTRLLGLVVLATLLTGLLVACSPGSKNGAQRMGEDPGVGKAHLETTAAPVSWDYVALGDSLAAGVGARRGYVDRYAEHLRSDTGVRIEVVNLGRSGQTSSQLLSALRNDPSMRKALGGAEVVTFNIGINDLGQAGRSYEAGTCGGGRERALPARGR